MRAHRPPATSGPDGRALMAPGLAAVAASREWTGEDGVRLPAGDVHAWWPRR
ncbi:hypothetical protein N8J89_14215 [Crossiella sp. CA-258035]|uniref:hypothetical protein n=1 Tax=Crossiella sp. CA-258035 TaxID=2981138 RepID=UPI0024BC19C8|nr:hypothetical protein [Crossiella sp. CA-258035]WHT22171.1 hypothetical protein N8J89_14215 [Crossiella sp. CA-258035]